MLTNKINDPIKLYKKNPASLSDLLKSPYIPISINKGMSIASKNIKNEKISADTKKPVEKLKNNNVNTIKLFWLASIDLTKTIPINITKCTPNIISSEALSTANTKFISGTDNQLNYSNNCSLSFFSSISMKTRHINIRFETMVNMATLELLFPFVSSLSFETSANNIPKNGMQIIKDKIAKGLLIYIHPSKSIFLLLKCR